MLWASLISSLEVARYDCLPHRFFQTFQTPLFSVKIKKKSNFQLLFKPVIFLNFFSFGYSCFMTVVWLEIQDVFLRFFSLI